MPAGGLCFDRPVSPQGYGWWYIDALSADGHHGLTLIAFVGSVFSPYYAWARGRGRADPMNHCALNLALYGRRGARWAMTERAAAQVVRSRDAISIGRSFLRIDGDAIDISVDEICAPIPRQIKGSIRLYLSAIGERSYALDAAGRHRWTPFAPCARIEATFSEPALAWTGNAYLDSNFGDEPLEDAFRRWTWSRADLRDRSVVLYDVEPRDGAPHTLALRFGADASVEPIDVPALVQLPTTRWRIARSTRADSGNVRVVQTLEDAPFYSRSLLATELLGVPAPAIHESLDLDRFSSLWVQCLLPFRMPRRFARPGFMRH